MHHVAVVIQHLSRYGCQRCMSQFSGNSDIAGCLATWQATWLLGAYGVLLLADNTVLVADNEEDLKHNIAALQEALREHKLEIN